MKNLIFLTITMILAAACDAPMRTRELHRPSGNPISQPGNNSSFGPDSGHDLIGGGTTGSAPSLPAGFTGCDLTDKYHTIDFGHFSLCQSTQEETAFIFKTSTSQQAPAPRVCLIPTYKDSTGSSTYIGQPQCAFTESNKPLMGQLLKNREGFSSYPLNGAIVMRESLLNEYFACMHAYVNWLPQACPNGPMSSPYCQYWGGNCPYGPKTNQACDAAAKSYMSQICTAFKSKYPNSYVDIRTRN